MEETLDPARQSMGDTKEGYYIGRHVDADSEEARKPLHGPNVWPDENLLPGWRETMEGYFQAVSALGQRLTNLLGLALGLKEGAFSPHFTRPMAALRLLRYTEQKAVPEEGIFSAGAHSDYGMITILTTDQVPGLQILSKQGEWLDVSPKRDCFIVNLG